MRIHKMYAIEMYTRAPAQAHIHIFVKLPDKVQKSWSITVFVSYFRTITEQ